MSTENPPSSAGHCEAEGKANLLNPGVWLSLAAFLGLVVWFFCFENRYGSGHSHSTLGWLYGSWNPSTDYEHGKLVPLVIIGLIVYRFKDLKNGVQPGSMWGLLAVAIGCLFYLAAYRTLQPRIAVGGLPFILWGGALYAWGWPGGEILTFPLFFLLDRSSAPGVSASDHPFTAPRYVNGSPWIGIYGGGNLHPGNHGAASEGDWKPLSIAHGCSGIRSLMALLMISAAWASVAPFPYGKKSCCS